MSVRQLYQLQCLDMDISAAEKSLAASQAKLNEDEALRQAKAGADAARAALDGLLRNQKDNDNAIADITARITVTNESLYSGRVRNPKELGSLQQELEILVKQRLPLEDRALTLMEKIESAQAQLYKAEAELKDVEARLGEEHRLLHTRINELKARLAELHAERSRMLDSIPPEEAGFYNDIKTKRGVAVARIDRGTCGGCRITLSSAELQRARSGRIVQCSSCTRILFFD